MCCPGAQGRGRKQLEPLQEEILLFGHIQGIVLPSRAPKNPKGHEPPVMTLLIPSLYIVLFLCAAQMLFFRIFPFLLSLW